MVTMVWQTIEKKNQEENNIGTWNSPNLLCQNSVERNRERTKGVPSSSLLADPIFDFILAIEASELGPFPIGSNNAAKNTCLHGGYFD